MLMINPIADVTNATRLISVETSVESCFHEEQVGTQALKNDSSRKKSSLHSKAPAVSIHKSDTAMILVRMVSKLSGEESYAYSHAVSELDNTYHCPCSNMFH